MSQQQQIMEGRSRPETSRGHYILEVLGIAAFFVLALFIGVDIYRGMANFGYLWLLPLLVLLAYLAADLLSGFVHFLADNFGSADTPILGPNFIGPFRDHHVDVELAFARHGPFHLRAGGGFLLEEFAENHITHGETECRQ